MNQNNEKYFIGYYGCDAGSLLIMNKNGAQFRISNGYGDGEFKLYKLTNQEMYELNQKEEVKIQDTGVWMFGGEGWKVMRYDCAKTYDHYDGGVEIDQYCHIYKRGTSFYIVTGV